MCPAHSVIDQVLMLSRTFPDRFGEGGPSLDLPLFPSSSGQPVDKGPMVATIICAARQLGVTDLPDGSLRVSGHSLRSTGAQGLISLGWRADAVRLQGRLGVGLSQPLHQRCSAPRALRARPLA